MSRVTFLDPVCLNFHCDGLNTNCGRQAVLIVVDSLTLRETEVLMVKVQ